MASTMTLTDQSGSLSITADFNPQSLSLTHSTSLVNQGQPKTGTQSSPAQVTGYQTALSFDLQFDTTLTGDDVRNTTERLVQLSRPDKAEARNVTVSWGTFLFTGQIQGITESVDFFSPDGVPLRAVAKVQMSQIGKETLRGMSASGGAGVGASFGASASVSASAGASFGANASSRVSVGARGAVGVTPLAIAGNGTSLQAMVGRAGGGASWKAVATANGIDNPRLLSGGITIDLKASGGTSWGS
ncbi:hypothetical protein [Candidatus Neomicrothrix sp.]|jgi:hypothetical protein|uniref:CIS tube protein n=1 Tax=Candidatus Neomicrothrix sp. TaxID=2719034 RepID=UPI001B60F655|nr:hypothetical protein [Candidatus Microthrix sp.]MBK6311942.1 hypothetical protein [Candidatus Microthrix sp.]MBP9051022.1 hypothetical protein [Ilumatobacteraceae bacterium]HMS49117.1 hypothetical protein [Candidatus Microthrix sp.]